MNNDIRIANGVEYRRDWDCDGHIRMINAKTLDRYYQLAYKNNPPEGEYFYAFSVDQVKQGIAAKHLENEKIYRASGGLFGTKVGIDNLFKHFDAINELIKADCNPQEVYFFEYNNHECMYSYEGDEPAIKLIIDYWGADVARTIVRIDGTTPIDELINAA